MASSNLVILGAAAALCVVPLALGSYQLYLAQLMMINVIAAAGLNLLTGNCGQISLCHSSFMAIGAYASALVVIRTGLSFLPALAIGTFAAALLGACLGYPARRLSGLYLALVTLGFLQLVQILIEEFPELTGGVRGLSVPKPQVLGYAIRSDFALYYVLLGAAAFAVFLADNLQRSRFGRAFPADYRPYCRASRRNRNRPSTPNNTFGNQTSSSGCSDGLARSVSPRMTNRK